ncbi:hypothetical protein A1O1_01849 [Capronia coronata CBS 617.96]|uniref:Telomeric single stranded DNA binding POT1/Cdc13 domain-containing protein n=1 Tax=Capronia coronata CBS 617.96 TaxID=1182541 RepID=W9YKP6_9EURO|nr:uncharacterized protein A1O1_01849 [Capronia coronata CBS 617.96]EXJ93457.1 hypothetical protein A1O1_01849 [Capronia coronata CBS 617.96]
MTTVAERVPTPPAFEPSASLAIAHLSPSSAGPSSYIAANVALVWPYSSSTRSLALLLADPDVRLRKQKGQVKVVFRDGAAKAIAETKVGIGDSIWLSLHGCDWKETSQTLSTPGEKIDWDLEFRDRVLFQIAGDQVDRATVDYTGHELDSHLQNGATTPSDRPEAARTQVNGLVRPEQSTIRVQLTPFKSARKYSSGTFIDASLDPFAEDDGYVLGKGRKRTKFARHSGAWSLLDSESAEEDSSNTENASRNAEALLLVTPPQRAELNGVSDGASPTRDKEEGLGEASTVSQDSMPLSPILQPPDHKEGEPPSPQPAAEEKELYTKPTSIVMGPPQTPLRIVPLEASSGNNHEVQEPDEDESSAATTPRLLPLASPGLPLVSPLIRRSGVELGYFPVSAGLMSQLEASGEGSGNTTPDQDVTVAADHVSVESDGTPLVLGDITFQRRASSERLSEPQYEDDAAVSEEHQATASPVDLESRPPSPEMINLPNGSLSAQPVSPGEAIFGRGVSPLQADPTLATVMGSNSAVVEIEDDDMYGAPEEAPRPSSPVAPTTSLMQAQSSLNDVEQSTQKHPTTSSPYAESLPVSGTPQSRRLPSREPSDATWEEQLTVGAVDCRSPVTYSAPPFPFIQNWHKSRSSHSSSRRSSRHSQARSLDGSVDEDDSSALDHSLVDERAPVQGEDADAAGIGAQSVASEESMQETREEFSETGQRVSVEEAANAIPTQEEQYVTPDAENVVEVSPTSPSSEAINREDPAGQLPTPDQTQRYQAKYDYTVEIHPVLQATAGANDPPSPQATQEETTSVILQKESQVLTSEESAAPAAFMPLSNTQPETTTYRRTSQRLSVRKSVMPVNMSSPYFTPRKSAPVLSSPLARKENIEGPASGLQNIPSSPTDERSKSIVTRFSVHEAEQNTIDALIRDQAGEARTGIQMRNGTTTSLSYYPHLTSLHEHFGNLVDVMAVCIERSTESQRSKAGPKDYYTTLRLADPSTDSGVGTVVQIFRPVQIALPTTEPGDAVIMRDFKVQTSNRQFMLLSTETSSWAVFKTGHFPSNPIVSGPPIEYGQEEASYIEILARWWHKESEGLFSGRASLRHEMDNTGVTDNLSAQEAQTTASHWGKDDSRSHRTPAPASRRKENRTDNANNEGDTDEEVLVDEDDLDEISGTPLVDKTNRRRESTASTTARSTTMKEPGRESVTPRRSTRGQASPSVVHELRDGTKYVDHGRRRSGSVVHELRDGVTYVDE